MRLTDHATRVVGWLALACHLLVAGGLPLPLAGPASPQGHGTGRAAAKDRSRPFPCMDKPCGCATAEQCFASCCCHTPAQRLAWAKAHGVDAAVLAALERRVTPRAAPAAGCCGSENDEPACCAAAGRAAPRLDGPDVCRDYRSLAAEPTPPDDSGSTGPRTVILRDMLACGGIVTAWLACGTALPPPPRVAVSAPDGCAGFIALADVSAPSVSAEPSAPPPRAA